MRIGILTFHFADNYGAVLQAFALREYLIGCGYENVEIINYVSEHFENAYSINPFATKKFLGKIKKAIKFPIKAAQYKKFKRFRKDILSINEKPQKYISYEKYDTIIVGSDQIWNFELTAEDENYFIPNEVGDLTILSYAASANDTFVPYEKKEEIKQLLKRFKSISVRESQLSKLLEKEYFLNSTVVLDPVFLIKKEMWENLCANVKKRKKNYIVLYLLKKNASLECAAKELSKKMQFEIITVHPTAGIVSKIGKHIFDVGPIEFVDLIQGAQAIVSNSFHAFAFGCLFSKKVYFEYVDGSANRIKNIIDLLNVECAYDEKLNVYHTHLDVYNTSKFIELKNISENFLDTNIRGKR